VYNLQFVSLIIGDRLMLGHLKPRSCQLSSTSKQHYQHLYCSICYSLRQQFGLSASFFINHELTLSLAAFPNYSRLQIESCACPAKLFSKQKTILRDPLIDKAAQLCLLLVWLKLIDSETDKPAFYKKSLRLSVENKARRVLAELSPATRQFIDSYLLLIRANSTDFATTAKMSGLLAKQIFQELSKETESQETVTEITLLLGELITVADALLDIKQDEQQQQFNPIINAAQQNGTSLEQEYRVLHADYQHLMKRIEDKLDDTVNPLFGEILQLSLRNLTGKIQHAQQIMFALPIKNIKRGNRAEGDYQPTRNEGCAEGCGGCFDCCQCCGESDCNCGACGDCECGSCGCD
jgi:hypothetical protein